MSVGYTRRYRRRAGKTSSKADLLAEDLVHDLGASSERWHDLMPVDQFRRRRLVVPGQERDPE